MATDLNQANQAVLRLALSQATFYYEDMKSVEFGIKHTVSALILARNAMPSFVPNRNVDENDIEESQAVLRTLERNLRIWKSEV